MIFSYLLLITTFQIAIQGCEQPRIAPEAIEVQFDRPLGNEGRALFDLYFYSGNSGITKALENKSSYKKGELVCAGAYQIQANRRVLLGIIMVAKVRKLSLCPLYQQGLEVKYLCAYKKRCGIGTKLLQAVENRYRPSFMRLETVKNAVEFYKKNGFAVDPKHSSLMIKQLH